MMSFYEVCHIVSFQQKTSMAGSLPGQVPQSQGHMGPFSTMGRNTTMPGPGLMTTASQDMNMANRGAMQGNTLNNSLRGLNI